MKLFVLLVSGFLLAVQFFAAEVQSSHYRGGTISYRPNSSTPYSVDFTFRLSFRRGAVYCDSSRVASRSLASTSFSNRWQLTRYYWSYSSSSYSGNANIYCTDFNVQEDWSEGNNTFTFTGSSADTWWNVRITDGGNWIGGMTYSNPYDNMHLDARVNKTVSGAFNNSSPVSSLPLTVYVVKGIPAVIKIPVEDPDGDIVRCRYARYQECYRGMCTYFPYGVLDEGSCTLRYNGGGAVGQLFPIILKLEDFPPGTTQFDSFNSLGSVDLQFVVHITNSTNAVRIQGGGTSGRLQVLYNGTWGTVCDDGWTMTNTHVVCRQLGFGGGLSYHNSGGGTGPIWLDNVQCHGNETAIQQCRHNGWGSHNCGHGEDVFVTCLPLECSNYTVLNARDRSQDVYRGNVLRCDRYDITPGWHRFMGDAGTAMPTSCVPMNRCGTHAAGWMQGSHPTQSEGIVTRRVCYHWSSNCCNWSNNIRVRNCGGFYVYQLIHPTAGCYLRYCGNATDMTSNCTSSPCRNGGTCVTTSSGYRCYCPSGYSGTQCETNVNFCASWPCRNGGTCNNYYHYGYQCSCPYGFTGRQCETRTICASRPCRNNGTCVTTSSGYRCYCPYGYSGTQCETNLYSCHSNPCRNGGSCHGGFGWYRCSCPYGYTGQQCQTSLQTRVTCGETFMQIDLLDQYFPGLDWRSLHLRNTTCRATKTPYTMRLRAPLDGCGVTYVEHDKKIAFWNEVRNEPGVWPGWGGNLSVISRGENLIIPFYCEYRRDKIVSTSFSPSKKRVYASEGSFGNFTFTMDLYQSSRYSTPYSVFAYPVAVYPNQPLWVQYEVKNTNADLVVFAENCRATTSTDPDSFPQHVFLERGCVRDPTMVYWYNPYSNVQRFSIRSFRFVYSNTFLVYLHCELLVCHRNTNNSRCARGCISGSRRRRENDDMDGSDTYDLSVGPMKGPNAKTETDKQGGEETSSAKTAAIGAGVGIAVVALLVGILVSVKMLHGRFKRVPPKEAPPPAFIMNQTVNSYEQHVMEDGERAEIEI